MSKTQATQSLHHPDRAPKWFATYTASHHEKRVQDHLRDRNVESFAPFYSSSRNWKKRGSVHLSLPLFPNYVFVRIERGQRAAVLGTPGVFSLVGSHQHTWEIPEGEIEALRNAVQSCKVEPCPYITVGDRVRVQNGPLRGLEGIVVGAKSRLRFVLTLDQIMKSVSIEINGNELEPIFPIRRDGTITW